MISYQEAIDKIHQNVIPLRPVYKKITDALGCVLAADVFSPVDIPSFQQSSMDGYALSLGDKPIKNSYKIVGEVAAGDDPNHLYNTDTAIRIFTGAAVPDDYDTVIMQEKTSISDDTLIIQDEAIKKGSNVRPIGSEIKKGSLALAKGIILTPAAIGFLASMGITEIAVFPLPKVSLIITGNELKQPGQPLAMGQIYDANSFTIIAALSQKNISNISVTWVKDDLSALSSAIKVAIEGSDLVLCTGGVSVGKYDFVPEACKLNEIDVLFHKVKQKPGKPIFVGTKNHKMFVGLPGNPASVLTCFYLYGLPIIDLLSQQSSKNHWIKTTVEQPLDKNGGLTHFLKGYYDGHTVTPLHAQESFKLSSFSEANCLVKIDEDVTNCEKGSEVSIYLLPK